MNPSVLPGTEQQKAPSPIVISIEDDCMAINGQQMPFPIGVAALEFFFGPAQSDKYVHCWPNWGISLIDSNGRWLRIEIAPSDGPVPVEPLPFTLQVGGVNVTRHTPIHDLATTKRGYKMMPGVDLSVWENDSLSRYFINYQPRIISAGVRKDGLIRRIEFFERSFKWRFFKTGVLVILTLLLIVHPFHMHHTMYGQDELTNGSSAILVMFGLALYIWFKMK